MKRHPYIFLIISTVCIGQYSFASENEAQYQQLLQNLERTQAEYIAPQVEEKIDMSRYKKEYEVSWRSRPQFNFSAQELKAYRSPVKVKMTVIASTGYIGDAKILKSSGSKLIDHRVIEAVKLARLDKIAHVDKTVTYTLVHEFDLKKPL